MHYWEPEANRRRSRSRGTEFDPTLAITGPEYNDNFEANHYQIEVAKACTVDSDKGALDNLARNAVKKACEDARK